MPNRSNSIEFIAKAHARHGDRYDYSQIAYIRNSKKVIIICPVHGKWLQTPSNHLKGYGCSLCANATRNNGQRSKAASNFKNRVLAGVGDLYNVSEAIYVNNHTKVKVICKDHGAWYCAPTSLYAGHGCPRCSAEKGGNALRKNTETFNKEAATIHENKYDYSLVDYRGSHIKVMAICLVHGKFKVTPTNHLKGRGCPKCVDLRFSRGAQRIEKWLLANKLEHELEKGFPTLKSQHSLDRPLWFDFCIPSLKMLIEFDGQQHFMPSDKFGGETMFKRIVINDRHKDQWAKTNNWELLRIPYKQMKNIESILAQQLL
jgi:very-short-patch-repair endonuclease